MLRDQFKAVYLETEKRLPDGLHDGKIIAGTVTDPIGRCSFWVRLQKQTIRIDFNPGAEGQEVLGRLVRLANLRQPLRDTKQLLGTEIGLRIYRGRFVAIESPCPTMPQPKEGGK